MSNYALSICSGDFNEWVGKNASTRSPYSYVWTGEYDIYEWDLGNSTFNYAEMAALIAPRPFMVERGHFDNGRRRRRRRRRVRQGPPSCMRASSALATAPRSSGSSGPHTIHGVGTFEFLKKHLGWKGVDGR